MLRTQLLHRINELPDVRLWVVFGRDPQHVPKQPLSVAATKVELAQADAELLSAPRPALAAMFSL